MQNKLKTPFTRNTLYYEVKRLGFPSISLRSLSLSCAVLLSFIVSFYLSLCVSTFWKRWYATRCVAFFPLHNNNYLNLFISTSVVPSLLLPFGFSSAVFIVGCFESTTTKIHKDSDFMTESGRERPFVLVSFHLNTDVVLFGKICRYDRKRWNFSYKWNCPFSLCLFEMRAPARAVWVL